MSQVQLSITPVAGEDGVQKIAIGFHSEFFSQCVYIPYTGYDEAVKFADLVAENIKACASEIVKSVLIP